MALTFTSLSTAIERVIDHLSTLCPGDNGSDWTEEPPQFPPLFQKQELPSAIIDDYTQLINIRSFDNPTLPRTFILESAQNPKHQNTLFLIRHADVPIKYGRPLDPRHRRLSTYDSSFLQPAATYSKFHME